MTASDLPALRDRLAAMVGQLAIIAANPAFVDRIASDPESVTLYRDFTRLGEDLISIAGVLVGDREQEKGK